MKVNTKNSNFIVLSSQRSGSTWLTKLIDNHPSILCAGEVFKHDSNIRHSEYSFLHCKNKNIYHRLLSIINPKTLVKQHLDTFFNLQYNACGFKLMCNQLAKYPYIQKYIIDNKIKIIILQRENIVHKTMLDVVSSIKVLQVLYIVSIFKLVKSLEGLAIRKVSHNVRC